MRRKEIIILIICLFVGFALRFYHFDTKSLWMDEISTFNDSRDDLRGQLNFYKENPTYLHPPLFFVLTHLFFPFQHPERDLRIIPLIFGTLSIPMIYLLARSFSPHIALPCTLSLTFMAYHISLSQDGRSYSLMMFLGMASLYFFMKHLKTLKKRYLLGTAISFAILFHTSYTSIPFIALPQILWFYRPSGDGKKPPLSSFFTLNGMTFFFCIPWILFTTLNYKGQPIMDPLQAKVPLSFENILYGIFHDWVPYGPLIIISVILLIILPIFSKFRKNAFILIAVFVLPIAWLYLLCKLLNISHFITSRYFITFFPLFLITLFLSLDTVEDKFKTLKRFMRFKILFVILFIASNLLILPLYYRSEKQDFKGLVTYLTKQLREGDKIFVVDTAFIPSILHYFGIDPEGRHFVVLYWKDSEGKIGFKKSFIYRNRIFTLFHSKTCCTQYIADGSRLWVVVGKGSAKEVRKDSPFILKGYFDGSFLNFNRFPYDASMYLFLWDPQSQDEKGIDMPIE